MNYFLFTTFLVFFSNEYHSNAHKSFNTNYFEGTITYKGEFIRKTSKFDSTTLAFFAGESSTLYAKEGNFLMKVKRGFTVRFLYRKEENKFYRERFNSDSVYWTRCDQQGQKILKMTRRFKEEKILGIECDELKVYYENKTVSYYYNSDTLKANPAWFKYLTIDNENIYSQEMKAVNLKSIIEYKDFVIINTAINIKSMKLDDKLFEIPKKPLVEDE